MRTTVAILGAAAALAVMCKGAEQPAPCRLRKGLYEERLALAAPPRGGAANSVGSDCNGSVSSQALDREYFDFFRGLAEASEAMDANALQVCRSEVGGDRIGLLSWHLVSYVAGGRSDSAAFVKAFPSGRKEATALWELDTLVDRAVEHGAVVPKVFLPHSPSHGFVDELFLLVLDGNEEAISRYFDLAGYAGQERGSYMDKKLALLFREAPSVLVSKWFVLRRHKRRLKSVLAGLTATPAEDQRIRRSIQPFCSKDDQDCAEILKLFGGR